MERKHIVYAILVVFAAITLSAVAAEAADWDHAQWLHDVGRHKIFMTNYVVVNEIAPEVEAIEAKLDDSVFGLKALNIDIDDIIDLTDDVEPWLKHTDFGLAAIDDEVEAIEEKLDSTEFGLKEIKAEVTAIEDKLDSTEFGLKEIKEEITDIWKLTDNKHGWDNLPAALDDIKTEIDEGFEEIKGILGDPTLPPYRWPTIADALRDIKSEIEFIDSKCAALLVEVEKIEAKLDDTVIPEIKAIEAKLDNETFGLAAIKREVFAIELKLDNETFGLAAIKREVAAIELKLDETITPLLGQGLVGEVWAGWEPGPAPFEDLVGGVLIGGVEHEVFLWRDGTSIVEPQTPKKFSLWVETNEMPTNEAVRVRVYYDADGGGVRQLWVTAVYTGINRAYLVVDQAAVAYSLRVTFETTATFEVRGTVIIEEV